MKYILLLSAFLLAVLTGRAQTISQKLATAMAALEADAQMKHAIVGFYVVETKTGKPVYAHNSEVGLAPASTQKLFTSAAVLELLGKDYRYKTKLGYKDVLKEGNLNGNLFILGSGDPTLGSWRWKETRDTVVLNEFVQMVKKAGIKRVANYVVANETGFSAQAIPDGWIWQDIGNYYGAGAHALNWKENQFELLLRSGKTVGDSVQAFNQGSVINELYYYNELTSAATGSGDNAYIYPPLGVENQSLITGTIPVNQSSFSISGAVFDPALNLSNDLARALMRNSVNNGSLRRSAGYEERLDSTVMRNMKVIGEHVSPPLDSINYWFLRRSINLYGEALVKTLAYDKTGFGTTSKGVELVRDFWQVHGIEKAAIHIMDGSGLSPQNRVTTDALVKVLQYAKTRSWYSSFYNALPEYNGMKMKSGSISGARAFAGYHTAKDGKEYSYAIIVNNYDGSSGEAVKKLYRLLDVLK